MIEPAETVWEQIKGIQEERKIEDFHKRQNAPREPYPGGSGRIRKPTDSDLSVNEEGLIPGWELVHRIKWNLPQNVLPRPA
jgi:hypothetical protein